MRDAVGPDYPVIFRFSQWKATDYVATLADDPTQLQELLTPLVDAGVDMLHPTNRLVEQFESGEFDVVATGRALLADPGWINKLRYGNLDQFTGYNPQTALASLS